MLVELASRIADVVARTIHEKWQIDSPEVVLNQTPGVRFGELATPVCLGLARTLRKPPRAIAEELAAVIRVDGVACVEAAGPGYINFRLVRGDLFAQARREVLENPLPGFPPAGQEHKVIVEHTNINPNKAAHIGHLRNAVIGDTFVRLLRATGRRVEVQNYIDNTGVQVADVLVGFRSLEKRTEEDLRALIAEPGVRFDYHCWDLYARVADFFEAEDPEHVERTRTLQAIEEGGNEIARMGEEVAMTIVGCHLRTMERIGVRYEVLPRESDILHLRFWERAFAQLREREAVFQETSGKNAGCWIMRLETGSGTEDKVIVRSNGTVTYVGKDIAYQLWKLGLLGLDFGYRVFDRYRDGAPVWVTTSEKGEGDHPSFGSGHDVYNVIDVRQAYPQTVVQEGVRSLGYAGHADRSIHFSYEMVALTPACAAELGVELSPEDQARPFVEVSGRKGQGVKADDLMDMLESRALEEVVARNPDLSEAEQQRIASQIAVGALRFFLLRFTRNTVIAFDFDEALSFDGETGPYVQYAIVRANNILRKAQDSGESPPASIRSVLDGSDDLWDLVYTAARIDEAVAQSVAALEPATVARQAFLVAQKFSLFYHTHRVLPESDSDRRQAYLSIVRFVRDTLVRMLNLLGIEAPDRM